MNPIPTFIPPNPQAKPEVAEEIRVQGTVQGVGFRPTVYRVAKACGLRGDVCNDGEGVLIRVIGTAEVLDRFITQLQAECPPLAHIEAIVRTPRPNFSSPEDFIILSSVPTTARTEIAPDAATCPQCRSETLDSQSRWYRYPFTNCTHCGPRLSIIRAIPYDRANTSMGSFTLCEDCAQEYGDVLNRRFHAQPVACPVCGPEVWLERADGQAIAGEPQDGIDTACTLLQQGKILAIKGMGGIHLACDATNETAVRTLRDRKHRYHKPFALMARDIEVIQKYCSVNDLERKLLESSPAPIVLLTRIQESGVRSQEVDALAPALAPHLPTLGFMLPYTPLHHLLLQRFDRPIVLTSGNRSDEPQCIDNQVAREKLGTIADYLLLHNRDIVNRLDDSVVRVVGRELQVLRRARGYAPAPIRLPAGFEEAPPLLAMGSELKNTFCLLQNGRAILSQHLGDLENAAAYQAYRDTLDLYLHLFQHEPEAIAVDLHPEYLSSKLGHEWVTTHPGSLSLYPIQHHHAHVAACLVENQMPLKTSPVLGIALDGLGYGEEGTLWGGEFLLADYFQSERLAHFKPIAMLGGEQAMYQPWRNTYAQLMAIGDENSSLEERWESLHQAFGELELIKFLHGKPRSLLNQMLMKGIQSPLASSAGRLFDAVAAAVGLCRASASYEGQGAIELEAQITATCLEEARSSAYGLAIVPIALPNGRQTFHLDAGPLWKPLLEDLLQQTPISLIAARFHLGLATAITSLVKILHQSHPFTHVALTGGVFQNAILLEQVQQQLTALNFTILTHHQVPANDGGLSLGQAAIAAARSLEERIQNHEKKIVPP
ncbi:MAG: carbamoyltransferase HypF [Leptolyngbyaceae cyanobacterium bins.59]|nr:carbamoyltransferase HypF [Leptolyngbyaceae cyanobacterium bins.59]